ncbi:MAG: hypothetical protein ACLFQH_03525, partial [Halothiobacillaceae bacterium]
MRLHLIGLYRAENLRSHNPNPRRPDKAAGRIGQKPTPSTPVPLTPDAASPYPACIAQKIC